MTFIQELVAISQDRNFRPGVGWGSLVQGEWARQSSDNVQAANCYGEAGRVFRKIGANGDLGILLHKQGWLAEAQGDAARAAWLCAESLALARQGDSWAIVSANLRSLAGHALTLGRPEWGAQLIGAAEALNVELVWSLRFEVERYERDRGAIYEVLGEKAFAIAVAQAQAMQPEQVDALAQRVVRFPARLVPGVKQATTTMLPRPVAPISARERQVIELVALDLSDAEIAKRLVISPRTVTTHLTSIYRKLGVSSRSEAVGAASDLGLLKMTD